MLRFAGQCRMGNRLRPRESPIRSRAELLSIDYTTANALGQSSFILDCPDPASWIIRVLILFWQIDACMEVCQYFGYYLPGSAMTAQMTIMQRAVNILYAFRDYSPMTSCLALLLLPIAVLLRYSTDEDAPLRVSSPGSQHQRLRFWIQALFVAAYISHALNTHFMYRHIGTARMLNFASHQVYASPCR